MDMIQAMDPLFGQKFHDRRMAASPVLMVPDAVAVEISDEERGSAC